MLPVNNLFIHFLYKYPSFLPSSLPPFFFSSLSLLYFFSLPDVLICLGCYNKNTTNWVALKNKFTSHNSEGWNSKIRVSGWILFQACRQQPSLMDLFQRGGKGYLLSSPLKALLDFLGLLDSGPRRKDQWPYKRLSQTCLWVSKSLQWRHGLTVACQGVRDTDSSSPGRCGMLA